MINPIERNKLRVKRHLRTRKKISGTSEIPRLYCSIKNVIESLSYLRILVNDPIPLDKNDFSLAPPLSPNKGLLHCFPEFTIIGDIIKIQIRI